MKKLAILGIGKMGGAILDGILSSGLYQKEDVLLYVHSEEKYKKFTEEGYIVTRNTLDVFTGAEIILLAIKPQMFPEVLAPAKEYDYSGKCIISIAAGLSITYIEGFFKNALVIRAMPNTPAQIKAGVTTVCANVEEKNPFLKKALEIFNSIGVAYVIPENKMDDSLPLNGSMPAYLFLFAKAFIDQAVCDGIDPDTAKKLAGESIIASARLMLEAEEDVSVLIQNVCSKGGTTIAGLNQLYENGFEDAVHKCAKACSNRSRELSK